MKTLDIAPRLMVWLLGMSPAIALAQVDPMDVFRPLVGSWTTTAEIRPSLASPEQATGTGEFQVRPILGGRFLQSEGFGTSPRGGRQEYSVILTWDERQQTYRRWVFRSDGVVAESTGVWDAETSTMTWSTLGQPENATFTVTTTIQENRVDETLHGQLADGTVSMDVTFTSRKKE